MLSVAVSLVGGLLFGYLFLDTGVKDTLDLILMSALDVMISVSYTHLTLPTTPYV